MSNSQTLQTAPQLWSQAYAQSNYPTSPLQSLPFEISSNSHESSSRSSRRRSESAVDNHRPRKRVHNRKNTWSAGFEEGPNVSQQKKEQELAELERLEEAGPAARKDKRRIQNRLAQRAFRARAKVFGKEVSSIVFLRGPCH